MSDERKYAVLSTECIKLIAGTVGFDGLPDEIAAALAEDVTYRLREAAQSSVQFMKHARRKKLTHEDFNRALRWSDVEPICGSDLKDLRSFRHCKEAEVFFIEDKEISLADISLDIKQPQNNGDNAVKAQWLALEGVNKSNSLSKTTTVTLGPSLSEPLTEYYEQVTMACLGKDEAAMKVALADLRSNSKIGALLPYLLNFVSSNMSKVSHSLRQLNRMLNIIQSLVNNSNLFLGPYLKILVTSLVHCILEPRTASLAPLNHHWLLRDYAALLLAQTLRSVDSHSESIRHQLALTFEQVFMDPLRPLCSQYGAIVGLVALGTQALETILLPNLSSFMPSLFMFLADTSPSNYSNQQDAGMVLGGLQMAAELLLHAKLTSDVVADPPTPLLSPCSSSDEDVKVADKQTDHLIGQRSSGNNHANLYRNLFEYFGDSLSTRMNASTEVELWLRREVRQIAPMEKYRLRSKLASKMSSTDVLKPTFETKQPNQQSSRRSSEVNRGRSIREVFNYKDVKAENMSIDFTIEFNVNAFKSRLPCLLRRRNVSKSLKVFAMESSKFAILNRQMKVSGKRRGLSWQKSPLEIANVWIGDIL